MLTGSFGAATALLALYPGVLTHQAPYNILLLAWLVKVGVVRLMPMP